jgi:formyltetrahydrofolate-dependent phosphoribosylglycinamide formyltransferase
LTDTASNPASQPANGSTAIWLPEASSGPVRIAVLLSGGGRTLQNLINCRAAGSLDVDIVSVVSSTPAAGGLDIAARHGLPAHTVARGDFANDDDFGDAIFRAIAPTRPELIVLAGFLRRLPVPPAWEGRILNIHPALLPESGVAGRGYYGDRVHAAVLANRATVSGATVHVVDNDYDTGPVVLRREVPVEPGDTVEDLATRVFAAECQLYPEAIASYVRDRVDLFGPDRMRTGTASLA